MKRNFGLFLVFAFVGMMTVSYAFAAEDVLPVPVEAIAIEAEAPKVEEAPATPAESTTEPTPSIDSLEGSISTIDIDSDTPNIKLKAADGQESAIDLDYESSQVWKAGNEVFLDDLEAGQSVKVRYVELDGKKVAKTVEIVA